MRTIGISHKTRYWQHYCFSNPPVGHRYVRVPDFPWHLLRSRSEFLLHSKLFAPLPKVDIYHTYNSVVANNRPWVVEVESMLPRYGQMDPGHRLYRWALKRLASVHCKGLVFTSCVARDMNIDRLRAAGVDKGKMNVIYRAVEQHLPVPGIERDFTILFAGNAFYRKGGVELLKAFQRSGRTDVRLVIISTLEVDWGVRPTADVIMETERVISEHPRITRFTALPHHELIEHMRKADLFVSTTFRDPFNNTVLEAMGTGLPVICSNVGALPEVARNGVNGWVLPVASRSSDDIAEEIAIYIQRLMDDPLLRAKMAAASTSIVNERFTLNVRNAELSRLYDDALASDR